MLQQVRKFTEKKVAEKIITSVHALLRRLKEQVHCRRFKARVLLLSEQMQFLRFISIASISVCIMRTFL
jgi:hypothetical protein